MGPFSVSRQAARRFLLETQQLLSNQKDSIEFGNLETTLQMIRKLECVQLDPVSVVERNQHLVLAARIPGYKPEYINQLLSRGDVFEYMANAACVIPMEDFPLFKPVREHLWRQVKESLEKSSRTVDVVLNRLKNEGPLPSREFKSENRVHGYWDNKIAKTKETSHALNLLLDAGIIRVVHREGNERYFDLTESSVPKNKLQEAETIGDLEARRSLINKYIQAYRLVDPRDSRFGWQKMTAADRRNEVNDLVKEKKLVPLQIENVKREYFIMAKDLDKLKEMSEKTSVDPGKNPVRFLSPLDNLLWRRERLEDLFDFHYRWEIYTPRSKRRFGAYAMPILYGDRLIGRMDPRLDRKKSYLFVQLLQLEPNVNFTPELRDNIRDSLEAFAAFHEVENIAVEQTEPTDMRIF